MKQIPMNFRSWGGKRRGAGGKPKGARAGVAHVPRKQPLRTPAHVTMRVPGGRPGLRSNRSFRAIGHAFREGKDGFGFRVVHFNVQGNHIHLLVETDDATALARGMKGLSVRMARAFNEAHGQRWTRRPALRETARARGLALTLGPSHSIRTSRGPVLRGGLIIILERATGFLTS